MMICRQIYSQTPQASEAELGSSLVFLEATLLLLPKRGLNVICDFVNMNGPPVS